MCECSTFWLIKLTGDLVSVADFFTTDITKQVLNVNGELLKALRWQVRFFTHDIIVLPVWYVLLEKTLRYGLALCKGDLPIKFGPILINTDGVL